MFPELPGYSGRSADGFHTWYQGELSHSIEPSGLQIFGEATEAEWIQWTEEFVKRATEILGYEVVEPEEHEEDCWQHLNDPKLHDQRD